MNPYKETLRKFFSEYVRTLRKCRGLTQEEMAEKLRISGRAYSDLERGIYCFSTVALVFLLLMLEEGRSLCFPEETLFFALKTKRNDGHKYIPDLYQKGAETPSELPRMGGDEQAGSATDHQPVG